MATNTESQKITEPKSEQTAKKPYRMLDAKIVAERGIKTSVTLKSKAIYGGKHPEISAMIMYDGTIFVHRAGEITVRADLIESQKEWEGSMGGKYITFTLKQE